jgi:hypothetical protein
MSIIIVGESGCTISHLSFFQINRFRTEAKIKNCFRGKVRLTNDEIVERTGMKFTSLRNHIRRMVIEGKLKKTMEHIENYNVCYYEVVDDRFGVP